MLVFYHHPTSFFADRRYGLAALGSVSPGRKSAQQVLSPIFSL